MVGVATVDAIRGRDAEEQPAPATTELEDRDALTLQLSGLGVRQDLLLYGDGCSVEVLELPSLEREPQKGVCSPRGTRSRDGALVAVCRGDETLVFYAADGGLRNGFPGCAPAWRPDGSLTLSRRSGVVRADGTVLIPRTELERAARRHPTVPNTRVRVRSLVDGIAWLSNTHAAVLLSIRISGRLDRLGPLSAVAFFDRGRLTSAKAYFRATGGQLAASPRGTYVSLTPDVVLRSDGSEIRLDPLVRDAHAVAWTDDERFLAVATRFAVTILDVGSLERYDRIGSGLRSVTLPLRATELAWR